MGDRHDRARAWRGIATGVICAALALAGTAAIAVAIPTQGENPHAWGVVLCGAATVALCARLATRSRMRLLHYRGADLPPASPHRNRPAG